MRLKRCLLTAGILLAACAHPPDQSPAGPPARHFLIDFYRGPLNRLCAVRSGECPMHPSCSEYSRQAIEKHGLLTGWVMTLDRLMRCGREELRLSPRIWVDGRWKSYDPVSGNDFWWDTGPQPSAANLRYSE